MSFPVLYLYNSLLRHLELVVKTQTDDVVGTRICLGARERRTLILLLVLIVVSIQRAEVACIQTQVLIQVHGTAQSH